MTLYRRRVSGEPRLWGLSLPAKRVFSRRPNSDYVVLLEGVNDYWADDHSALKTKSNIIKIMNTASKYGAIVLLGNLTHATHYNLGPWVTKVDKRIDRIADIDFYSLGKKILSRDGLHPKASGYDAMAAMVANALLDLAQNAISEGGVSE